MSLFDFFSRLKNRQIPDHWRTAVAWVQLPTSREQRRFLEHHPELLALGNDFPLGFLPLSNHQSLLRDAQVRGGTAQAIREAYVNIYGGSVLDLPSWLEAVEQQLESLKAPTGMGSEQAKETRRDLLRKAILRAQNDRGVACETLAELQFRLGNALDEDPQDCEACEAAIAAYQEALRVYTLARYPLQFVKVQDDLGSAYGSQITGGPQANLERAIACFEATLHVYTLETTPVDYARIQYNLGYAYQNLIQGKQPLRQEEVERVIAYYKAALQVYTRDSFPADYAKVHYHLGLAYSSSVEADKRASQEQSISCYKAALQVYTRMRFPDDYARTQHSLGKVYSERIEGSRRENLEQAIACFEAALPVFTPGTFEWATLQSNLGIAYSERIEGSRRENREQAITCLEAALPVFTRDRFPADYARTQYNLGLVYGRRIEGEPRLNREQAIACLEAALQIYTLEDFPIDYARAQNDLGTLYAERIEGKEWQNLERAIVCHTSALLIYTRDNFPVEWAHTQRHLGNAYWRRISGEPRANIELAISCLEAALDIYERYGLQTLTALAQNALGLAYCDRIEGAKQANLEQAIAYNQAALQVYTLEAFPVNYAHIQQNLGTIFALLEEGDRSGHLERAVEHFKGAIQVYTIAAFPLDHLRTQASLARAEMERKHWAGAHEAYANVLAAQDILLRLSSGIAGHDAILQEGRDAAICDGLALTQLGQIEAAAVAIERGRARGLAEAMNIDSADPGRISDAQRRSRYEDARQAFIDAQNTLNTYLSSLPTTESEQLLSASIVESMRRRILLERTEMYQAAKQRFESVVAEIRQAQDPADFLDAPLDEATILRAAEQIGPGHALLYLAATRWGGVAVAALSAQPTLGTQSRFAALLLPALTYQFVGDLLEPRLGDGTRRVIGGFGAALESRGLAILQRYWSGVNFRESATALHDACMKAGQESLLDEAAQAILSLPAFVQSIDQPFEALERKERTHLESQLSDLFLELELEHCLTVLAENALQPLVAWLREEGVGSMTLIPCGWLSALPLVSAPLADGRTVGEALPASIAPNVRSLLRVEHARASRSGLYAIGDPRSAGQPLRWGEAEAHTLARLARNLALPGEARVHRKATRAWLIEALRQGAVVDISCHGHFDTGDFLQSALLLSGGQQLTLADIVSGEVDLHRLRQVILSACQTAMLDMRGMSDEVHSLSAAILQAGANAVMGSLWSVSDKATYLLMVRFAQEWLPGMESEPPAAALARAQHWLRTVTNDELQQWRAMNVLMPAVEARREAGSEEPEEDPWTKEERELAVQAGAEKYSGGESEFLIRSVARRLNDPNAIG